MASFGAVRSIDGAIVAQIIELRHRNGAVCAWSGAVASEGRPVRVLDLLYAKALELRPAMIFVDDADELLRQREFSASTDATNKLLVLMDRVSERVRDAMSW